MSKTVDELHEIYRNARLGEIFAAKDEELVTDVRERAERAGIAAVIRTVRDELENETGKCLDCSASGVHDHLDEVFNRILGSDAGEKVAGNQWTASTQPQLWAKTPATAPAPAVCEWTETSIDPLGYAWLNSSCGLVDCHERDVLMQPNPKKHCPSCGKPIKFTEAQR